MKMRQLLIGVISVSVIVANIWMWKGRNSILHGPIHLSQPSIFFDEVVHGATSKGFVVLTNESNQEVHIRDVLGSCVCMNTSVSSKSIPPGQSVQVGVAITGKPGTFSGEVGVISVRFQDESIAPLKIPVFINKVSGITVVPSLLDFGSVRAEHLPEQKKLYLVGAEEHVVSVESSAPREISITRMKSDSPVTFLISILPDSPKGEIRERLVLHCKDKNNIVQEIKVSLIARIVE